MEFILVGFVEFLLFVYNTVAVFIFLSCFIVFFFKARQKYNQIFIVVNSGEWNWVFFYISFYVLHSMC